KCDSPGTSHGGSMKLKELEIINFRGVGEIRINLEDDMTILIGRNGSGKTTVLDAIASCLSSIQIMWPKNGRDASFSINRIARSDARDPNKDSSIKLEMRIDSGLGEFLTDDKVKFVASSNKDEATKSQHALYKLLSSHGQSLSPRPLFVYYQQDRAFESTTRARSNRVANSESENSLNGDLRAISSLEEWWDKRDAEEARAVRDKRNHDYRDTQLEAIRTLVREIDTFSDIFYSSDRQQPGLYLRKGDGAEVHVSRLSSGERSYIILLADLARRLQLSDPESDLGEISGVVLIDEIELNLHPAWQSEIIPTLRQVFRSCQFIIATHSPQVLSAIESSHVRSLIQQSSGIVRVDLPQNTKGRSSNYLLEGVLGATERFPNTDKMIEDFNSAIDELDAQTAHRLLSQIEKGVEGSPPELLVLKSRLKKLKGRK
ncbi:AAA family ATPase, partial [Roseinatronobacter monicus]|uniref:AAA family ATPase n=1 Tax=Roseinatronobacter monicus TaxID=393481 RepID=UPI003F3EEFB3